MLLETSAMMSGAQLHVQPTRALVDEPLIIRATGLKPSQLVTIVIRVNDGARFYAHAHYRSDEEGVVDVTSLASVGGDYTGVQPMGLVCYMHQEPGQSDGMRLVKQYVTSPILTDFFLMDGHVNPAELLSVQFELARELVLSTSRVERWYKADGVQRIEVRDGRLVGTLFLPEGEGPFPGLLDLFGTIGGTVEHRSALLASRGFASLTLCYFTPGRGEGLVAEMEYFEEAIDWLQTHPKVRPGGVGALGVSKGAELVMMIASLCPDKIAACVEINGIHMNTLVTQSYKGEQFPMYWLAEEKIHFGEEGAIFEGIYDDTEDPGEYAIPLERSKCPFLLVHGADDRAVPAFMAEYLNKRLKLSNLPRHITTLVYPGTGHVLEPPYSPHFYSTYHALFQQVVVWGGNPRQHALAQEDSWRRILSFLRSHLPDGKDTNSTQCEPSKL